MGNSLADSTAFRRRLRTAVWASWLAPYALFCLFAATSSSASQFTLIARLGPATFAAMLGSTLAAAVCLSRITNGSTFLRVAAVAVSLHTLFVATVAFYDADMNLHASATSVAVLVAIAVLYGTTLSVPFMLASADLHARNLGSPLPLSQTARHWLPVGGVGLAGGLVLVLALAMPSGSWFGVALLGVSLLAFAGVAATLATRASAADLAVAHDRERAAAGEHEDRVKRILMFAESITDYFFELDAELRVSGISERFTELTGFEAHEIIGRSVLDPLRESPDPEAGAHIETLLAHRPYRGFRFELTTKDGRTLHLQASAVPFFDKDGAFAGYRGCGADTTPMIEARRQLRRKEAELMQAQKMEAVGQLTGGLAHDFNNLLSAMVGNLELLKLRTDGDPTCSRYVDSALEAAARAAALTNRLLAFSRRQALSPRVVDVLALLRDMEDLMRRTLGEHVSIRIDAAADLTGCIVDPHQLENAVLNIAINARDAMREGGEIVISADNFTGARNAGRGHDAGRYVRIAISDNGAGIAPYVLPHVFEPFFTTKEPGRGSGLGLSMVYGFVQQSGGHIEVTSEVGKGTTVTMLLPAAAGASAGDDDVQTHSTRRLLLVVADDPDVAEEIATAVRRDGHHAIVALSVEEARRAFEAEDVALVIVEDGFARTTTNGEEARFWERTPHLLVHKALDPNELNWRVAAALACMPSSDQDVVRDGRLH